MKLAKKTLSIFLALLMLFSACSVGLTGVVASAAPGDSKYSSAQVIDLVNAATANGFTLSSAANEWNYTADDGSALAAADAIFDYAVKTYREGRDAESKGNSTKALYDYFTAEFKSQYANATAADRLVKNVLDPDGATIYSSEKPGTKSTKLGESTTEYTQGTDVTGSYPIASNGSMYAAGISLSDVTTKKAFVQVDMTKYLTKFSTIDEIPSSFLTSATFTYNHVTTYSATVSKVDSRSETTGEGCDAVTTNYYTPTISTSAYNYMTGKPTRQVVKNTTAKKNLLALEKFFNEELYVNTRESMLGLSIDEIETLYKSADSYYNVMKDNFSKEVIDHFGLGYDKIVAFMEDCYFAYRVVAGMHNIDVLNNYIGSEYNEESYAEMSSLYNKVNTAYNVVFNMDAEIVNYIVNDAGYADEYDSAVALKSTADSYMATLYDVMTEQRLEELAASMLKTYEDYNTLLNKEDIETPADAEVLGLVQKVEGYEEVLATYTSKAYYRNYWTTAYEADWAAFNTKLDEVVEVRGLKMEYETYYSYFMPIIFTNMIVDLDNDTAIALHQELDTKLTELRTSYNNILSKWGGTIADKIFTINYEGTDYLLQTLIDSVKSTGKELVKANLIARTEAQLDTVEAYKGITEVNFNNFASIKSTLTYFDYDLYNYVIDNNLGLSSAYVNKYAQVQTLLDKYHAFSTSDGKAHFNEGFTFADENGYFGVRYAGDQVIIDDEEGGEIQIGYPSDLARSGAEDNYYVTADKMENTVARLDNFIISRDFGALLGFTNEEEEYIGLEEYLLLMIEDMLYTDDMMNTLVSAIFPMICELIEAELVGALGTMDGAEVDANGVPWLDIGSLIDAASGKLALYLDTTYAPGNPEGHQKNFMQVFADLGLYIYPASLADSLLLSNPASYGVGSPIYEALKAAGRDWTQLVCADDPETPVVDETKALAFEWGVYDEDSFIEVMACILDSILPLLQAVLTDKPFEGESSNAAIAYSDKITALGFLNANKTFIRGGMRITIDPLNAWSTIFVPLFEVLGVEKIPTVSQDASGYDIADALIGTLLKRVKDILKSPLTSILDILPNLVYFVSMDSVQEIINSLKIHLNLNLHELDVYAGSGLGNSILGLLEGSLAGTIEFPVDLNLADEINLYDMLGFEISDFNEILKFALGSLTGSDATGCDAGCDAAPAAASPAITLPPIRQQDIIFCSDWSYNAGGRVDLNANKADLMYWLIDYLVQALTPDAEGNSLLTSLLGSDMDPMIASVLDKVISQLTNNPRGALAAIIEILNPVTYDLAEMNWAESAYNYNGIEGANNMSIVYLNYGNDWTREKSEYLMDNLDALVKTVLSLVGSDMTDIGDFLAETVNGLFTNANITALVKMLGGLGDSPSAVINDVVANQVGINIESWYTAFGYLFPASTWAEDAEIIMPDDRHYVNNFGVEGIANEDGTISWFFNKMPLNDGDGYTFVNILSRLLGEASLLIEFLFAGEDVSAFENVVTLKGYETYDTTFGLLFEMLGVDNLPTQADFNADAMGSFTAMLTAVLDWFYALTSSDDMIEQLVEIIPDLFYFIESNGLSTFLHNLLMPVLVLVDTVRPIIDVDVNGVLSILVSELLNYKALNIDAILPYVINGVYQNDDPDFVYYSIDINNLTFSEIIKLVDGFLGTDLYNSGLVNIGIKGFCSGIEKIENTAVGTVYKSTVDAADTVTLLVTALLDCLSYPAADGKANGDVIFELVAEMTGKEEIAGMYGMIAEVIKGVDVEYADPDWGYMFTSVDEFSLILPAQSIVYLDYTTDWDKETADAVYSALDEVLELVLPMVLEENETIGTLLNGLLEDNVYSDEILNTVVELIVNLIAGLDASLFELVDVVLDTDIATWFTFCDIDEATGEYVCTKDWGVDEAADKKTAFIAALKEVLAPANELLAWVFFGEDFTFFTGSETDAEGKYVFNDVIALNGGEGYAYGLAPIFEALGCTLAPASDFYNAETGKYNVPDAVEALLNSVFALVDEIAANPVEGIFDLLPNIIYFINADGIKTSVNNLLAPVDAIIEKLSPVISEDGSAVSIGGLLEPTIGLNISKISMDTLLGFAADAGFVLSAEMVEIIKNLYVGKLAEFTSANGRKAYRLDVEGAEGDVLTIVLSIALDAFNLNADLFSGLLGEETYYAVYNLIKGASSAFVYRDMNWAYMYEGEDAASQLYNNNLPERTGDAYEIYTQYQNNWNEASAEYIDVILDTLVKEITTIARNDGSSLGQLLDAAISGALYKDDILNSLIEMVVELLVDYEDIIKKAGVLLGAEDLAAWFDDYCEITTDENGEKVVTCVKDWGIDSAATNAEKRTAFVEGFVEALRPAYRLLAWLLFGEDYTFFNGTTNEVLVTIKGGEGYNEAFVPLLEGLSATMNYEGTASGIKPASAFYVDGELDMEMAVRDIFTAVTDWLAEICGDLNGDGTLSVMLEKLPNVIYFINADGLKVVVNNLLQPVNFILDALKPMGVNVDFATLIEGIDITNFDFYAIFDLLEDLVGLYFPEYTQKFLATFFIGQVVPFESANGKLAYRMTYSEEETRKDMITCLISFVVDAFVDERNDAQLSSWLGEDVYNGIIAVLGIQGVKAMQEFSWILTEYADTDKTFTGLETSKKFEVAYNNVWTEDKAEYIAENLPDFVNDIISILGLNINGVNVRNADTLINTLLTTELYTQATADALLDVLKSLPDLFGEYSEIGKMAITLVDNALGTSIGAWETMTVEVVDGDRDSFLAALKQMIAPIVPVLDLLLCGENIELFYSIDGTGRDALTIYGSEGYAYGLVPLFEALGCTMMTPAEFKALDDEAKVGAILNPLLDRVDAILADPVNEIFDMLPAIIYFINSNGLDTAVKNIINSVDTVLMALEPLLGAPDLMTLLGVDLATYNFEYLIGLAVDGIEESTGMDVTLVLHDFVAELTTGKVVSYQSANGETYYTMEYAGEWQESDMVTIVLRLLIDFLAEGNNADAIIALIANNSQSDDATSSASALIKFVLTALATEPVTSGAMATLYYIFYGIHTGIDNFEEEYTSFNKTWKFVFNFFETFGDPVTSSGVKVLRKILDTYFDGIVDSDGVADEGVLTFWDRIVQFFQRIGDFFRKLFGMA
ncbi:MAG: hypothetical protein IKW03_08140 [Clostridia bacterium]|nr:hypothetical protein [Clostridia bacterium]